MTDTLRTLNEAAYAAARDARKAGDPHSVALNRIALEIDDLVEAAPVPPAARAAPAREV